MPDGRRIVPTNRVVLTPHFYNSTACFHGQHDRCRLVCKFCPEPCRCDCHAVTAPARGSSSEA